MIKGSSQTLAIIGVISVIILIFGGILLLDKSRDSGDSIGLNVGDEAPDFSVEDYSGKTISLADYADKNILLYFNEGVICAPCWQQIIQLQKDREKFMALISLIILMVFLGLFLIVIEWKKESRESERK